MKQIGVAPLAAVVRGDQFRESSEVISTLFADVDVVALEVLQKEEGHASVPIK